MIELNIYSETFKKLSELSARIGDERMGKVWSAYHDRCSVSMRDPDVSDWTDDMKSVYSILMGCLNPF